MPSRCAVATICLLLCNESVRAQETPCLRQTTFASAVYSEALPVTGFEAKDFRALMHGQPLQIISLTLDIQPRRIILLFDSSDSMLGDSSRWNLSLTVATDLLARLPPDNSVALVMFTDRINETMGPTQDREALENRLNSLRAGERALPKGHRQTALWDSIRESLALLGTPHLGDVIYAITDGDDNSSRSGPEKVAQALLTAGVRLFAFLPPYQSQVWLPGRIPGPTDLLRSTDETGGMAIQLQGYWDFDEKSKKLKPRKGSSLESDLGSMYHQIVWFYRVELAVPQPIDKPVDWKLELTNEVLRKRKDLRVIYPQRLMPCMGNPAIP